jgi:hypothetical protein
MELQRTATLRNSLLMNSYVLNPVSNTIVGWFEEAGDARLYATMKNAYSGAEDFIVLPTGLKFTVEPSRATVLMKAALAEVEKHTPTAVEHGWIICSCDGGSVKPNYWTRHVTGADGSFSAPRVLETVQELELADELRA